MSLNHFQPVSIKYGIDNLYLNIFNSDRSPGLVVMGGDSCYKGRGFESDHQLLVGLFLINLVFEEDRKNEKRPDWPNLTLCKHLFAF